MFVRRMAVAICVVLAAILAALAPAWTQETGAETHPITISGGSVDDPYAWTGQVIAFRAFVKVREEQRLQRLSLEIISPKAGKQSLEVDVKSLTLDQTEGKAPVEWRQTFQETGDYVFFFVGQAVGNPEVERFPNRETGLTFRVSNVWWNVGWTLVTFIASFLLWKLVGVPLAVRLVRKMGKVAPFGAWAILFTTAAVGVALFLPAIPMAWVAAGWGVVILGDLIYLFT